MLTSCKYCGKIHDKKHDCGKRPPKRYQRTAAEAGRYTYEFQRKSIEIKQRSNYLCAVCLDEGALTYDDVETHHIIKLRDRPDLLVEDSNLVCLCKRHHTMADRGEISVERLRELALRRDGLISPPGNSAL